jgi:hypothetical protein
MSSYDPDGPTVLIARPKPAAASPRPDRGARARRGIYAVLDWLKHGGWSVDWLERTIDYWRDLGIARAIAITLLVVTPLVKFVWLPWMGSRIVATVADVYGLDLEVVGWTGSWFDLEATATNVTLKSRGRHTRAALAEADAITMDLSFWRWVGGYGWVKSIHVKEPKVFLERSLAGRWNWDDLQDVTAGSYSLAIATLRLDDLRVEWIEHLPGASGSGVVHSSRALLYVEGTDVLLQDVVLPLDPRSTGSRFSFNGRTADGVLAIEGSGNFFRFAAHRPGSASAAAVQKVSTGGTTAWSPTVDAKVYLENVGVAAVGQMLARGALMPAAGTMTGNIQLTVAEDKTTCKTDLQLMNVSYAPNPNSGLLRGNTDAIRVGLNGVRVSKKIELGGCEGDAGQPQYRPLTALQASITRAAVEDAPPFVKQAALVDDRYNKGEITDADLLQMSEQLAQGGVPGLMRFLAADAGASMTQSLLGQRVAPQGSGQPNGAMTRGVKNVGRSIKRLFGK